MLETQLKVHKSRKQFFLSSILPKNERKDKKKSTYNSTTYIWNLMSIFFVKDTRNCFRDLLTFKKEKAKISFKLANHLRTSGASKNRDYSCQKWGDFPFVTLVFFFRRIFPTNFWFDEFFDEFYYFNKFSFFGIFLTYNLLTIVSFRTRVPSILFICLKSVKV